MSRALVASSFPLVPRLQRNSLWYKTLCSKSALDLSQNYHISVLPSQSILKSGFWLGYARVCFRVRSVTTVDKSVHPSVYSNMFVRLSLCLHVTTAGNSTARRTTLGGFPFTNPKIWSSCSIANTHAKARASVNSSRSAAWQTASCVCRPE